MRGRILLLILALSLVFTFSATAQNNVDDFVGAFEDFADAAAPSMPMLADVGLRWSDAYIGHFPHFGVGTTVGFVAVPIDDLDGFFTALDIGEVPQELEDIGGVPIPALAFEGRIGGFVFPFDIGVKAGFIPEFMKESWGEDIAVDYQMVGFDLRYRLVKEGLLMPEISVGGGYTYLKGSVGASVGEDAQIDDGTEQLTFNQPDVVFGWTSSVIDAKAQISKNVLLILRPYAGIGLSYGVSEAGGGVEATVTSTTGDLNYWKTNYGSDFDDIDTDGATVYKEVESFAMRAYLGTAVNLTIFKFDLSGSYNPGNGALGAQFNVRAQF